MQQAVKDLQPQNGGLIELLQELGRIAKKKKEIKYTLFISDHNSASYRHLVY